MQLCPMTPDGFSAFLERNVAEYANEKVKAGNWAPGEALDRSRAEHAKLLPEGLATPDHYLFSIRAGAEGALAGAIWLAVEHHGQRASGFVYDLFVFEAFRRSGVARRAMLELEARARELGLVELGLHVFAHNTGARALYEGLGYRPTNIVLKKDLGGAETD